MSYSLDRLNEMITSEELYIKSKRIMAEYQDAIDKLMADTVADDVKELTTRLDPNSVEDLEQLASEETARRMSKYGGIFFESEIERLMDAYNDGLYDEIEYKIRCEILSGLAHSLKSFTPDNIEK